MQEKMKMKKSLEVLSYQNAKAKLISMCSEKEMKEREETNHLSDFEIDPLISSESNKRAKKEFVVKAYRRSAADKVMDDPENIRPPEILLITLNYLLNEIIDIDVDEEKSAKHYKSSGDYTYTYTFSEIANFVEDRTRQIRQDFTILNLKGNKDCIICHEKNARFLILCLNEGLDCEEPLDLFISMLNKTLTSLREFYDYVEEMENEEGLYVSQNVGEFISYGLLLSLNENYDLLSLLNKMPKRAMCSKKVRHNE